MEEILILRISMIFVSLLSGLFSATLGLASPRPIRIPLPVSVISLDPSRLQDQSSLWVSRQLNCQLVRHRSGTIIQDAAQEIHFESPTRISFRLKESLRFVDGSPVTASDVLASFEFLKRSRLVLRNTFQWIEKMKVRDLYTFELHLKKPVPQFLTTLSSPHYAIFPKDFIKRAQARPLLWKNPVGCGSYRIDVPLSDEHTIRLTSLTGGLNLEFSLVGSKGLSPAEVQTFDISTMATSLAGNKDDYVLESLFDPYHITIGLNTRVSPWNQREMRCRFLSQLNPSSVLKDYGDLGEPALDLFPRGILGYTPSMNYQQAFRAINAMSEGSFSGLKGCFSFVTASVPESFRNGYKKMIEAVAPNTNWTSIEKTQDYAGQFERSRCLGLILGLKSNYFDGYEFLVPFLEKAANFTGFKDKKIQKTIESSQNIAEPQQRSLAYQTISKMISDQCLVLPLVTIPNKKVLIRKGLLLPRFGECSLNEYDFSKASWTK